MPPPLPWFGSTNTRADAGGAAGGGAEHAADGLIESSLAYRFLDEEYWPRLFAQANRHATPPWMPYSRMARIVAATLDRDKAKEWLSESLRENTREHDTIRRWRIVCTC